MKVELNASEQAARQRVILPLDNLDTMYDAETRVRELSPFVGVFKVGKGSFTRFGHDIIDMVHRYGSKVFLDLKYHDIPNTVEDAACAAAEKGVYMFTVHASGGIEMLEAAVSGARRGAEKRAAALAKEVKEYSDKINHPTFMKLSVEEIEKGYELLMPKVLGVTVLTSLDEALFLDAFKPVNPRLKKIDFRKYVDMNKDDEELHDEFRELLEKHKLTDIVQDQVQHLVGICSDAGIDNIVCSAMDLGHLRKGLPDLFEHLEFNTPGIKLPDKAAGTDQKRVYTPEDAIHDGATRLVAGRTITEHETSEQRQEAAYKVVRGIASQL